MMQEASFTGLLKTILIIILVYYTLKLLARIFAPFLFKYAAKKFEQKFGNVYNHTSQGSDKNQKEGETVIDSIPNQHQKSNKNVGEYIDFEEID
ncbi:DUF4834 family protein [Paucihalobacter ruber]|uniref:DUF4834 family protein n=1 Tax=Paucihalobacter ruber TaxID=2567861 RepID=A0A506PER6_9FLAO|nr:DUF4834 family protein [Paucihalobacter ruber]TPV32431.1 DUF4834 family protein [Paucihalobacter ruber]